MAPQMALVLGAKASGKSDGRLSKLKALSAASWFVKFRKARDIFLLV